MRFFIILSLALSYSGVAISGTAALTSVESPSTRRDFINHFAELVSGDAKQRIDESLSSILDRLEVPHVEGSIIQYPCFFKKIQDIVDSKAPGAKAYISGGMVRSLLGYVYKKMHHMMGDVNFFTPGTNPKKVIEEVLYDIIQGKRRTDALLSEFNEDSLGGKRTRVTADGETINLPNLGRKTKFKPKELTPLQVLGVASDYDVLIEFPDGTSDEVKESTRKAVKVFVNSAQKHFGFESDQSELKRAMVPDADVNEYCVQMNEAVLQGGATLDWFALPVSGGKMKLPPTHPNIMDDFIQGNLCYIANEQATDKQTMRVLRILLEIPFLTLDQESARIVAEELRKIIDGGALSPGALEQLKKMTRNARFGGARNRFAGGDCMPDGEVTTLVQELAHKLEIKTLVLEFLGSRPMRTCPGEQVSGCHPRAGGDPGMVITDQMSEVGCDGTAKGLDSCLRGNDIRFMPYAEFIKKHTDNGILYHGTPDIMNFLSMIRNGLVVSSATQGKALYGYGVYTTKDCTTAEAYTKDKGVVIPLTVNESAHIVNMDVPEHKEHYEKWRKAKKITEADEEFGAHFKEYALEFGIDIIIVRIVRNSFLSDSPLIQNAKAIYLEKNLKAIIEADRALVRAKVRAKKGVKIKGILRAFSSTEGYGNVFPPSAEDLTIYQDIKHLIRDPLNTIFDIPGLDISELVQLNALVSLGDSRIDFLKELIDARVVYKLRFWELERVTVLPKGKVTALIDLFKAGVINNLCVSDLKLFAKLSEQAARELITLFKESVICRPTVLDLTDVGKLSPLFLTERKIKDLKQLIDGRVMSVLTVSDLKHIPADLSNVVRQIPQLQQLIQDGVMSELTPLELKYVPVPADMLKVVGQIKALKQLIDGRVMSVLTVSDLKKIPADLSNAVRQIPQLQKLIGEGVMGMLSAFELKYVPVPADMLKVVGQIKALKKLIEAGVISRLAGCLLIEVPHDLPPDLEEKEIEYLKGFKDPTGKSNLDMAQLKNAIKNLRRR